MSTLLKFFSSTLNGCKINVGKQNTVSSHFISPFQLTIQRNLTHAFFFLTPFPPRYLNEFCADREGNKHFLFPTKCHVPSHYIATTIYLYRHEPPAALSSSTCPSGSGSRAGPTVQLHPAVPSCRPPPEPCPQQVALGLCRWPRQTAGHSAGRQTTERLLANTFFISGIEANGCFPCLNHQ